MDWAAPLDKEKWAVKPEAGLRGDGPKLWCKGFIGLRGWKGSDWVRKEPVAVNGFVAELQLPRGKLLALPLGAVGTGPLAATHWCCPCGQFSIEMEDDPALKDRLVSAWGLLRALQTAFFCLMPVDFGCFQSIPALLPAPLLPEGAEGQQGHHC